MERFIARLLLVSRWLLVPLYLGLALLLLLFIVQFFSEFVHLVLALAAQGEVNLTLEALRLVDLVLVAGLVVMVMISGFENFLGAIDLGEKRNELAWLTELDAGSIKVKIVGAISVISAIYLLEQLFELDQVGDDKLLWLVLLQLTFVITTLVLALTERFGKH
ncbi:MAG TPA: TIGR00645 family protein [Stellaceae bacterium]|nr:TIGR00645 family protein [Stellaceae bacterium]